MKCLFKEYVNCNKLNELLIEVYIGFYNFINIVV